MRGLLQDMSRRGFLGRLFQFLVGLLGASRFALGQASGTSGKLSPTPHMLFAPADAEELQGDAATIARRIREAFPYLKLDPAGVAAFARDYVAYRDAGELRTEAFLGLRDRFLLSTTFFDHGGDESKLVEYAVFYDPYVTPCSNRLATRLEDDDEAGWW